MSHAKDRHYWAQLRGTITTGSWEAAFPAKAPNGSPLSWSELFRKFNKHCVGFADVAELVSQTQALSLLLAANAKNLDYDDHRKPNELALGDEGLLSEERVEEGSQGYTALQGLRSSLTEPVILALAYYSYALGRPAECLRLLERVTGLEDVQARVAAYGTMRSDPLTLGVPVGSADGSSSWTGSLATPATTIADTDISDGRGWAATECARSICLRGMSLEKLHPDEPQRALAAYQDAIPLMDVIASEVQNSLTTSSTQNLSEARAPSGSFIRYRELWRWVERLLRRAIVLAAHMSDVTKEDKTANSIWTLFSLYRSCSVHWPTTFRPRYRSTVATLHLRAFVLRAHLLPPEVLKVKAPRWISTARSVLQELRSLLSVCTHFPRAGERNVRVEDFVDLCVAVWEADGAVGEYADWVIDFLWWATRLTFNSFRIYRHMTRLFAVSGDPELAQRTLRLYIQVVSKVREAGGPLMSNEGEGEVVDADSDSLWVQTLVQGSRMLCRIAVLEPNYGKAVELAHEAGTTLQKARTRLAGEDKELLASVQLAEGIWHSVTAYVEQDARTRANKLSESQDCFMSAINTFPTASTHHHLALSISRAGPSRDMQGAIEHARAAVEGDSGEVRHWHLLGLLLAATDDWRAAKGVLEVGIGVAEADLSEDDHPSPENGGADGLNIKDFARTNGTEHTNGSNGNAAPETAEPPPFSTAVPQGATVIPPSSYLLQPVKDRPTPTRQERFEYALQMRMTQLALTEFVEGAEGVGERWLEVFQWFREKRPASMDDRRKSIDSRRISQDTRPSEVASIRTQQPSRSVNRPAPDISANGHADNSLLTAIPIKVTPATPGVSTTEFDNDHSPTIRQQDGEKRSTSLDEKDRDVSRGKKVKEVLKDQVHKSQARITTISRKIGHGVGRRGSLNLKRITSAPDFQSMLHQAPYQASSIHLRQYHSIHASQQDLGLLEVPPPPPASSPEPTPQKPNKRAKKDRRLLSDLWLMSAAIFRRLGKVEQTKVAIQEAEVRDEDNPAVWVQLGLYYVTLGDDYRAIQAFQKALFAHQNDVAATIYLCRIYLSQAETPSHSKESAAENVDLAVGLLEDLTRGAGWDVPEAWYFLAKAYKLQGRRDRERECLSYALSLSETRGVRDVTTAVGWCL